MDPPVLTDCYSDGEVIGTGPLDPTKETTFAFLKTLLAEVAPLFEDKMFMVGERRRSLSPVLVPLGLSGGAACVCRWR